jgi:predicted phage terminase large subunit-like protein
MILDAWDELLQYPKLRKKAIDDWKAIYGGVEGDDLHPGRRPDNIIIENKGSGQSLLQDLRAASVPAFAYNPGKADKMARLQGALPLIELDLLYVIESKVEPRLPVSWVRAAIKQITTFPAAEHDEYVDCLSQALLYLRDLGLLDLPTAEDEDVEETEEYRGKGGNPYNK